jgi:hypothetical protein
LREKRGKGDVEGGDQGKEKAEGNSRKRENLRERGSRGRLKGKRNEET